VKGSCSTFGARRVGSICAEIEERCGRGALEEVDELLSKLEYEVDEVEQALGALV
jgi:HPt (histidine-containing phosphotransfer) domain-containing protein